MSIFTLLLLFFKYYFIILVPFGHVKMMKRILESYIHMKSHCYVFVLQDDSDWSHSLSLFLFVSLFWPLLSSRCLSPRIAPLQSLTCLQKKHRSFRTTYLIPLTNCCIAMMSRLKSFWTRNVAVINGKLVRISPLKEQR